MLTPAKGLSWLVALRWERPELLLMARGGALGRRLSLNIASLLKDPLSCDSLSKY